MTFQQCEFKLYVGKCLGACMKDEYCDVNGIKMHYVTEGEGPLVLLLHGFPQFWYAWRKIIPQLSQKFKVVAPDLRGYGETDKPQNISDYKLNNLSKDIVGLIKHLGYSKAFIVGHDWGGAIGWELALTHPEVVDKLVTINAPHPAKFAKAIRSNYKQMGRSWYMFFAQIPKLPEYLIGLNTGKFLKGIFRGQAVNKEAFPKEELQRYIDEYNKPGVIPASMHYYRAAFRNRNNTPPRVQITTPTLVIWGEKDKALGKELTYDMDKLFSGPFKIEYLPDSSHWVLDDQPDKVVNLVKTFL